MFKAFQRCPRKPKFTILTLRISMRQDLELRSIDPQRLSTCAFHRLAWRVYSAGNAKPSILKANETENGAGEQGPGLGKIIEAGQVLVGFQVVEGDETHWHTVESA